MYSKMPFFTHLRSAALLALLCTNAAFAQTPDDSADIESRVTGASNMPSTLQEANERYGSTTIISTIDNPLTTNIVAWQETANAYNKNTIEFSALKEALTPTDRDQLTEETLYSKVLNQNTQ